MWIRTREERKDGKRLVWAWLPHRAQHQKKNNLYRWLWMEPVLRGYGHSGVDTWTIYYVPTEKDIEDAEP